MSEDDRSPEEWVKDTIETIFGTTNDEEVLNEAPDTRPGPEETANKNLTEERMFNLLLTLWFNVDGLTTIRQQRQDSFQLPLKVLQKLLERKKPDDIAKELGCNRATVFRYKKSIVFVIGFFDVFIKEFEERLNRQLKEKLTDQTTVTVFHRISIGWDRKKIIRQLEEKTAVIDRAYLNLRCESAKIWDEFKYMVRHDPESLVKLIEAQRQTKK
jgi:hypothetical protein